jgi:pre-rRNA-processing protein IPI3
VQAELLMADYIYGRLVGLDHGEYTTHYRRIQVASGILYNSWEAHYRKINVIKFTQDGAAIITGSEDSAVHVWQLSRSAILTQRVHKTNSHPVFRLLDEALQNEIPSPYCSFSEHTLAVTDIVVGIGEFHSCRVLTTSLDRHAKVCFLLLFHSRD